MNGAPNSNIHRNAAVSAQPEALGNGRAAAPRSSMATLRTLVGRALDQAIHEGDHRPALPVTGFNAMGKPTGADWSWRPCLWKGSLPSPGQAAVPDIEVSLLGAVLRGVAGHLNRHHPDLHHPDHW